MRIAFVTHQFFPRYYTGVERLTLNLAEQLSRMGHESIVITAAEHAMQSEKPYFVGGTRVRPIRAGRPDLERPWLQDPSSGERLGRVLDEEGVELVHVMHPMRLPQAFDEAHRRQTPVVCHLADFGYLCARTLMVRRDETLCPTAADGHACVSACGIRAGVERMGWARQTLSSADAVVSPSRFLMDVFAANGFDVRGWHHIPWGVDYAVHPKRLTPPAGPKLTVGFIGTLLPHKGVHVLIEAVRLIEGRDIELLVYGSSFTERAYERDLRKIAKEDGRIRFEGSYRHGELSSVLAPLDVVAIPSLWYENLPTTGLNAVAAGVPIVASDVGGLRELVDEYDCGFVFPMGRADALAELLAEMLDDGEMLRDARSRMHFPPGVEEEAWRIERIYEAIAADAVRGVTSPPTISRHIPSARAPTDAKVRS